MWLRKESTSSEIETMAARMARSYNIVDTHIHVFDLELRAQLPNKNFSHEFPNDTDAPEINR